MYQINRLSINIISLLLGFFIATALSTIPSQTGDSSVVSACMIITYYEIMSKLVYDSKNSHYITINILKYTKIGIIYGLFVEAFKLGS